MATISTPVLEVGRLVVRPFDEVLASLRARGCTVSYAQREKHFLSVTYYNLSITGDARYLQAFKDFVAELNED